MLVNKCPDMCLQWECLECERDGGTIDNGALQGHGELALPYLSHFKFHLIEIKLVLNLSRSPHIVPLSI